MLLRLLSLLSFAHHKETVMNTILPLVVDRHRLVWVVLALRAAREEESQMQGFSFVAQARAPTIRERKTALGLHGGDGTAPDSRLTLRMG